MGSKREGERNYERSCPCTWARNCGDDRHGPPLARHGSTSPRVQDRKQPIL